MKEKFKAWLTKPIAKVLTMLVIAVGAFALTGTIAEAWCTGCTCMYGWWDGTGQNCKPSSGDIPCHPDCGGHNWTAVDHKSPTCTSSGYLRKFCSIHNGWHDIEYYPATGHNWGSWHDYNDSEHYRNCHNGCGTKDWGGHTYGGWDTNDNDGYHRRYCTKCNHRQTQPNPYTVRFNPNGASNTSTATTQAFTYGVAQNLKENTFKKEYTITYVGNYSGAETTTQKSVWTFKHWNTKADNTGTAYANKQSVSNLTKVYNATVDMYAIWNVGYVKSPLPTRTGYIFDGWYDKAEGGNLITKENNASFYVEKDTTLYAHWTPITYYIDYSAADATGGNTTPNPSEHKYDIPKQLSANGWKREYKVKFNYNNYNHTATTEHTVAYKFLGWYQTTPGSVEFQDKQEVVNLTTTDGRHLTFYAVWEEKAITLPAAPDRPGYDFLGWYTDPENGTYVGQPGQTYIPKADTELYCHWKPHVYTFVYHSGDKPDKTYTQVIEYNDSGYPEHKTYILSCDQVGFTRNTMEGKFYPDTNTPITMTREHLGWTFNRNYSREHSTLHNYIDFHVGDDITMYTTEDGKVYHVWAVWKDLQPYVTGSIENTSAQGATHGTNIFRAGEFGVLNFQTDGYVMKATVKFPEGWKNYDPVKYGDVVYTISNDVNTVAKEWATDDSNALEFQVPIHEGLAVTGETYYFTVTVTNKYGKNVSTTISAAPNGNPTSPENPEEGRTNPDGDIPLEIRRGSIADDLRTRLKGK